MPTNRQNVSDYYRFCPGEEAIKISDAICLGRRRGNFPKCKDCQFNDDARRGDAGESSATEGRSPRQAGDAKREQIETLFTPSDIRGRCPELLDEEIAWRVGLAIAQFLRSELRGYDRSLPDKATVIVGHDMRKTTHTLTRALSEGLRSGGSPIVELGMIDVGQLYFATNEITCCGGVLVGGSHRPPNVNGIFICGAKGREIRTETGLGKVCKIAQNTIRHSGVQMAPTRSEDLGDAYRAFVRNLLSQPSADFNEERPLRVVADAANGLAGRWLPLIFDEINWLEIIRLNFEHNGTFVHDPDPTMPDNLAQLADRVVRSKADLGVCFDGDAGRAVFVDNQGQALSHDVATALIARNLLIDEPGATIVHDLAGSQLVTEEIKKAGGFARRERRAGLRKAIADAKAPFGSDHSCRFFFREIGYGNSGLIALTQMINLLTETGTTLDKLTAPLDRHIHDEKCLFACEDFNHLIEQLADTFGNGHIDYLDGITVRYDKWWFNLRPVEDGDLLELKVEADNKTGLKRAMARLMPILGERIET